MARVSIVMPAFNPGRFIYDAIQSIVDQTYRDWELIVVDDGSAQDFSELPTLCSNLRLLSQPNRGAAVARNLGILNSCGDLIAFMDSDDLWKPKKLELQVHAMNSEPEIWLCYTDFEHIDSDGAVLGAGKMKMRTTYADFLQDCLILPSTVMIRREALAYSGLFDPLVMNEDHDMWLKLARQSCKFKHIQSCEASWRRHSGTVSGNLIELLLWLKHMYLRHEDLARGEGNFELVEAAQRGLRATCRWYGWLFLLEFEREVKRGNFGSAAVNLANAAANNPELALKGALSRLRKILLAK